MVQPTVGMAERYSKQRIAPMLDAVPELKRKLNPTRGKDSGNTITVKQFPGGLLTMIGAVASAPLSSTPTRFLFMDEVDRYPGDVDGEGDPVGLAIQRTANFTCAHHIDK